jgi:hypothetical protein
MDFRFFSGLLSQFKVTGSYLIQLTEGGYKKRGSIAVSKIDASGFYYLNVEGEPGHAIKCILQVRFLYRTSKLTTFLDLNLALCDNFLSAQLLSLLSSKIVWNVFGPQSSSVVLTFYVITLFI